LEFRSDHCPTDSGGSSEDANWYRLIPRDHAARRDQSSCQREPALWARRVTSPPKGPPRDRWLTRSEAAKLLWGVLALPRAANRPSRSPERTADRDGQEIASASRQVYSDRPAQARSRRHRRTGKTAIRSSTSTKAFSIGWQSAAAPPTSDRHRRRFRRGCWRTCDAGFVTASSCHFSWSGRARRVKSVKTGFKHAVKPRGSLGQGDAAHAAAHGGDVADAARVPSGRRPATLACRPRCSNALTATITLTACAPPRRRSHRNNRRTFHWSFRWSSRNRARPKDKKANSCMVEDSVLREPVSTKIPC
jgi:hypothetical protein